MPTTTTARGKTKRTQRPKTETRYVAFTMNTDDYNALKDAAVGSGRSVSGYVRFVLCDALRGGS